MTTQTDTLRKALEVARQYVKLQNRAEGIFEGFGGRKPRPSDADLQMIDEALTTCQVKEIAGEHMNAPKLIGREPTEEMIKADPYGMGYGRLHAIWCAMWDASPQPAAQEGDKT